MFTYSGWNAAAYVAEEIKNPGRNVPLALGLGTAAVIVIYVLLNLVYLFVLPVGELAKVQGSVLDVIADRLLGTRAGDIMGIVSIISIAASISAMTFAGPRVYYAMARDGLFVKPAANVHRKYRTPAIAIIAQAVWSGLLVLSGSAQTLTTYTGFAVVLFAGIAVSTLFVLRRREPDAPRPFRAWGYPFAPAVFTIASAFIVANALWTDLFRPIAPRWILGTGGGGPRRDRARSAGLLHAPVARQQRVERQQRQRAVARGKQQERRRRSAQQVVDDEERGSRSFQQRPHHPHVSAIPLRLAPGQVVAGADSEQEQPIQVGEDAWAARAAHRRRRPAVPGTESKRAPTTRS